MPNDRQTLPGGTSNEHPQRPAIGRVSTMDFLVEFEINVPEGTPQTEVTAREGAESAAAAKLVDQGHLVRLWKRRVASGESRAIGLYRAESEADMDGLLRALPLYEWMGVSVTPLEPHPNDPAVAMRSASPPGGSNEQ
jgi:muconolactone D-isomerase